MSLGRIGGIGAAIALTAVLAGCGKKPVAKPNVNTDVDATAKLIQEANVALKATEDSDSLRFHEKLAAAVHSGNDFSAKYVCTPLYGDCLDLVVEPARKKMSKKVLEKMESSCKQIYETCVKRTSRELNDITRTLR